MKERELQRQHDALSAMAQLDLGAIAAPAELWALVAAETIHARRLSRRRVERFLTPYFLWTLGAFAAGAVATEALRSASRATAEASAAAVSTLALPAAPFAPTKRQLTEPLGSGVTSPRIPP